MGGITTGFWRVAIVRVLPRLLAELGERIISGPGVVFRAPRSDRQLIRSTLERGGGGKFGKREVVQGKGRG